MGGDYPKVIVAEYQAGRKNVSPISAQLISPHRLFQTNALI